MPFSNKKVYPQNDIYDRFSILAKIIRNFFFTQSINSCKINIDKIMRKDGLKGRFHVKLIK